MNPTIARFRRLISWDSVPTLLILLIYISIFFLAKGVLPTGEELITDFSRLYARFGYEILFVASFLEATVVINFFAPGQVALILGIIFARTGQTELDKVIATVVFGAGMGYGVDYVLGRFGFADILRSVGYGELLRLAKQQLIKLGKRGLILGFIHANIASFISLAAGAAGLPFRFFGPIALLSTIVWTTIWSLVVYSVGDTLLHLISKYSYILGVLVLGSIILTRLFRKEKKRTIS